MGECCQRSFRVLAVYWAASASFVLEVGHLNELYGGRWSASTAEGEAVSWAALYSPSACGHPGVPPGRIQPLDQGLQSTLPDSAADDSTDVV